MAVSAMISFLETAAAAVLEAEGSAAVTQAPCQAQEAVARTSFPAAMGMISSSGMVSMGSGRTGMEAMAVLEEEEAAAAAPIWGGVLEENQDWAAVAAAVMRAARLF